MMTTCIIAIMLADWQAKPISVAALLIELLEQTQSLTDQVRTPATRVAQLKEQKGRSFRNSSQPPSCDGHDQCGSGFSSSGSGQGEGQGGIRAFAVSADVGSLRRGYRPSHRPVQQLWIEPHEIDMGSEN